jgi:hypothetical protein
LAEAQARQVEAQKTERTARKAAQTKPSRKTNKTRQQEPGAVELEAQISRLETELRELASLLATEEMARDYLRLLELSGRYQTLEAELQELYQAWERALAAEALATPDTQ